MLVFLLLLAEKTKAQNNESVVVYDHRWTYSFTIEGIEDIDEAKYPSAIISKYFKVLPSFNVNTHRFLFECKLDKTQFEFEDILDEYEFQIIGWSKVYTGRSSADNEENEAEKDE